MCGIVLMNKLCKKKLPKTKYIKSEAYHLDQGDMPLIKFNSHFFSFAFHLQIVTWFVMALNKQQYICRSYSHTCTVHAVARILLSVRA